MQAFSEATFFGKGQLVAVLTTLPIDRVLDYKAPEAGVVLGAFVRVPVGPRLVPGIVWGKGQGDFDPSKIRPIAKVLDIPPMVPAMQRFLESAAAYTLTPLHQMMQMATRTPALSGSVSKLRVIKGGEQIPARLTKARERVLALIEEDPERPWLISELSAHSGSSHSVIRGLIGQGALCEEEVDRDQPFPVLNPELPGKHLTKDQEQATGAVVSAIEGQKFTSFLLKGVTGSGKTEVYLEAVAACLRSGRQALVLLPEIALTVEFVERVQERFGARAAEWHSGITQTEKRRCWQMVAEGQVQLVVGARSALFLPFSKLGLIVIDEEHDSSFKQEDAVVYNARDMAVLRASISSAVVVLASATPSLESWVNAEVGKYKRLDLPARFGVAQVPEIDAIDMRENGPDAGAWISPPLAEAVRKSVEEGGQVLLFLNRRGYAPLTLCRACGFQLGCPDCDARLVEHRFLARLICHQCGYSQSVPDTCPSCDVEGKLAPVGPGIERLAEEAQALFPDFRIALLSSDVASSTSALKKQINMIAEGGADLIIGTQMVAKGHNFPLLTCVGVIDADLGLQGGDLRAAERTFQLMHQVAGRAGRAEKPGRALIQTFQPEHPVIEAIMNEDDEAFWQAEAAARKSAGMPPFGRLVGIVLSGPDEARVSDAAFQLARQAGPLRDAGAEVYGPVVAPIARIRGRFRMRLLIQAPRPLQLQPLVAHWCSSVTLPNAVRLRVDIDPQSFF